MQTVHASQPNNRFDMYTSVHKGMRAFMADVLTTVGRIDAWDPLEVHEGIAQVRTLLEICRHHLFIENQFIHSAMEARRRGSACPTATDHVEQERLMERIEAQVLRIERGSGADRELNVLNLYRMLGLFVADNCQHMHVEERDNNETLWSTYTDEELRGIHQVLLESIEPAQMNVYRHWILPYITHRERIAILARMRQAMTEPDFDHLLSLVQPQLSDRDWEKLSAGLSHFD